ncbi:response regulator [Acidobacteriia bacterium AH_259_A11_L15]|nr:response regulator [Acidobacteriia bacterium AH_259_A11_L15]
MTPARLALVADDAAAARRLMTRLLKQQGWNVVEATNGEEALKICDRQTPALILLDLRMPGPVDGLLAASLLRQRPSFQKVPIIAVSASPYQRFRQRALQAGCTAFLSKPLNRNELVRQLRLLTREEETR